MLKELVSKEVKNLLRDKKVIVSVIIMPFIIFAVMGAVYGFGFSHMVKVAKERVIKAKVLICDNDEGNMSSLVIEFSKSRASEVSVVKGCGADYVREKLSKREFTVAIIIPKNFTSAILSMKPASVEVYTWVSGISMSATMALGAASSFASAISDYIRDYVASTKGVPPEFISSPLHIREEAIFRGQVVSPDVIGALSFSSFLFIFAPLIVITSALGIASTSMAVENEEKTLEILLTLPIPRSKIILGKLIGSSVVVILATISYMAGFIFYIYMVSMSAAFSVSTLETNATASAASSSFVGSRGIAAIASVLSPATLALVAASTFISLVAVASLGILLGSMAPEVRVSQTYIGQLSFLVIVPAFIMMFMDISSLGPSGTAVLIAISPFIAPMLVLKALIEGYSWVSAASILWSLSFAGLMIVMSSKLLGSEKLFAIQYRFAMRGKRIRVKKSKPGITLFKRR